MCVSVCIYVGVCVLWGVEHLFKLLLKCFWVIRTNCLIKMYEYEYLWIKCKLNALIYWLTVCLIDWSYDILDSTCRILDSNSNAKGAPFVILKIEHFKF